MKTLVRVFVVAGLVAATLVAPLATAEGGECISQRDQSTSITLRNCVPPQCRVENDVPPRISCPTP